MARTTLLLLFILSTIGISAYLLHRGLSLQSGTAGSDVCADVLGESCDAALKSTQSKWLGLPLAGWQFLYSATLLSLLLLGWSLREEFEQEAALAAFTISAVAAMISIVLLTAIVLEWVPLCAFCLLLQGLNVAVAVVLKHQLNDTLTGIIRRIGSGIRWIISGTSQDPSRSRSTAAQLLVPSLVAIVVYQWLYIEASLRPAVRQSSSELQESLTAYQSEPVKDIPISPADPRLGNDSVPAQLIVFSDFRCLACRRFSVVLNDLLTEFDGELSVVFKHLPLSNACNPTVKSDFHPGACDLAWAADVARQQQQFWDFHNALFASMQRDWRSQLETAMHQQKIHPDQFSAAAGKQAARQKVEEDILLAEQLGLRSTPSVFLNGRRVTRLSRISLRHLIRWEIEAATRGSAADDATAIVPQASR